MSVSSLVLHAGGTHATVEEVEAVAIPAATRTYGVVPHATYRRILLDRMPEFGLHVREERIALAANGQRVFGLLCLAGDKPDYEVALGYRNSYDRSMVAGLVVGSRVFVCDNLAFSGERQMRIKHTSRVMERLEHGVPDLLSGIRSVIEWQDRFISGLKDREMNRQGRADVAHELMLRKAMAPTRIAAAVRLGEGGRSRTTALEARTAWDFYNAFTAVAEGMSADRLMVETKRMTAVFARHFSLN